jgi:hypothetical protein
MAAYNEEHVLSLDITFAVTEFMLFRSCHCRYYMFIRTECDSVTWSQVGSTGVGAMTIAFLIVSRIKSCHVSTSPRAQAFHDMLR